MYGFYGCKNNYYGNSALKEIKIKNERKVDWKKLFCWEFSYENSTRRCFLKSFKLAWLVLTRVQASKKTYSKDFDQASLKFCLFGALACLC